MASIFKDGGIDKFKYASMTVNRSKIFGDVVIAWKCLDVVDYSIWLHNKNMVCPSDGMRVETIGM